MLRELKTLLPYMRRYRATYAVGIACILASIVLRLSIPDFVGRSFDTLTGLAEGGDREEIASVLVGLAAAIVGAAALGALIRTASRILVLGISRRAVHDLRTDLFDRLLALSPSFYVRHQTGDIMSRAVNDTRNVQGLMGPVAMWLAETAAMYAVGLTMMLRIDPLLTLFGILPFPFFLNRARKLARRIQTDSRAAQEGLAEVSAKVDESLSGQMVIKTLALEDFDRERFRAHCDEYRRLNLSVSRARSVLGPMMSALSSLSTLIVLAVGSRWIASGRLSLGDLTAMILYLGIIAGPTATLGFIMSSLQRGAAAVGRVRELMEMEVPLADPDEPSTDAVATGSIRVEDLTVVYPPLEDQPHLTGSLPAGLEGSAPGEPRVVLDGVSFEVPAGSTLGIVGATGSGKTTLLRALARQLEVEPGQVFIDGVDVTSMRLADVRQAVGIVPQDGFLFSDTLRGNVALGRPEATDEEIVRAVEIARLSRDLDQLPDGLETVVGERGVNLSGGQRQRAGLARALVVDPKILILDDSLSAVDTHTSDEILAELKPIMAERTTILVAHRASTVQNADQILVLDEGRVVERGTHGELLAVGGRYAALFEQQQLKRTLERDLGMRTEGGD